MFLTVRVLNGGCRVLLFGTARAVVLSPIRETVSEPVSVRKIADTIVAASTPDFSTDPTETSPFVRYARRNKFDRTNLT